MCAGSFRMAPACRDGCAHWWARYSMRRFPSVQRLPSFYGTYMHAHSMRNSNKILDGDQTSWEENFYSADKTPPAMAKSFVTWILLHDLFGVPNVLVTGRMPWSGKLLVLLIGQKSGFSPRRGDSLHRFTSNLAGPTGTWVRLAVQNFTSIATRGGNAAPKISKISTFW